MATRRLLCPYCDEPVTVPAGGRATRFVRCTACTSLVPVRPGQPFPPPAPPTRRKGRLGWVLLWGFLGALGLAAGITVAGILYLAFRPDQFSEPMPDFSAAQLEELYARHGEANVVTVRVAGITHERAGEDVVERLKLAAGSTQASALSARPEGGQVLTVRLAPVSNLHAFTSRMTEIGRVMRVDPTKRLILVAANPARLLPAPVPGEDPVSIVLMDLNSPYLFRRREALRQLEQLEPGKRREDVARTLEALLGDRELRRDAVRLLARWGTPDNAPALLKLLDDRELREEALATLDRLGAWQSWPNVEVLLNQLTSDGMRVKALEVLARLKHPRTVERIASRLTSPADRDRVVETLQALGPMAEKTILDLYIGHKDPAVRVEACRVLQVIGTKRSVPRLKEIVDAQDFFAAPVAEEALKRIGAR
jgi:HEAT repeat protein